MPADTPKKSDYQTLKPSGRNGEGNNGGQNSLKPSAKSGGENSLKPRAKSSEENIFDKSLVNPDKKTEKEIITPENLSLKNKANPANDFALQTDVVKSKKDSESVEELQYAEQKKEDKKQKRKKKDRELLSGDHWFDRNGHNLTYIGIFIFTLFVYFRPYELFPSLMFLSSAAQYIAIITLLVYLPIQFSTEGTLTTFSTEVKCVLFMAFWALLTMPIAKSPALAWEVFNDPFIKVVLIFIVMVNTLRTQSRLKWLMWLSIGVGILLSYQALDLYMQGKFATEGYRVNVDFGGMFGNPNDMAIHLVIFTPIAVILGLAAKNRLYKILYFVAAAMMIGGNMVTQSRGGFLGLLAVGGVLVWKLGKKQRAKVLAISAVVAAVIIAAAPGDYAVRILSIFIPGLDEVGSADQRMDLLKRSILVTIRNPWGIGIGNFPIVGYRNLQTHNAFTQISSELGWLAFCAYMILIISPLRKLGAIERQLLRGEETTWFYYLAVGLQASIAGYMVSSFFGAVAYNWYIYYPIAYAVCLRRIYQLDLKERGITEEKTESRLRSLIGFPKNVSLQK